MEIEKTIESLNTLEKFLSEVAALDSQISFRGLIGKQLYEFYENAKPAFEAFDQKLYDLTRLANLIDKNIFHQIDGITRSSNLADAITQISVTIKVAERRRELENSVWYSILSKWVKIDISGKRGIVFNGGRT